MSGRLIQLAETAWTQATRRFLDHNYRQTWSHGIHAAERIGAASEHVGLVRGHDPIALADVRIKSLPLIGGIAYINGGPVVRHRDSADHQGVLAEMLDVLRAEYVTRRGMVLRVIGTLGDDAWNAAQESAFRAAGFAPTSAAQAYRTMLVRVDGPLEKTRAALAQKWRNCLNNAEKQGTTVTVSDDHRSLQRFTDLYEEFVGRKGLHVNHDAAFFARVQEGLDGPDRMIVQLAEREGQLIAGHLSAMNGDTCVYLLGATAPAALKVKAAYLLQWNAIRMAHERGLAWYDLGGVDPNENPGVFHFKEGMSGIDRTAPGPYEAAPRGIRGRMALSSERIYRRLRDGRKQAKEPQTESAPKA